MDRSSYLVLPVIFVLVFAFSGCNSEVEETSNENSAIGGVSIEFLAGTPPTQIIEKEDFDVTVNIENTGEYDVEDDIAIFLIGVNPKTIGLTESVSKLHEGGLTGAHYMGEVLVPGEIQDISWSGANYLPTINSDQNLKFVTQVCYPYKTIATIDACFSSNVYSQATGAETCAVAGEKAVKNTVSPIKVTSVVENPAGSDKYSFVFTIENVGDGTVFKNDMDVSECISLSVSKLNQVFVDSVKVGNGDAKPECLEKSNIVRLIDGVGTYTCTFKEEAGLGDYADIVEIMLSYNYYTQENRNVLIQDNPDL